MKRPFRAKQLDPDNRRVDLGEVVCVRCNRNITGAYRTVHVISDGAEVLHPSDEHLYVPDAGDMGGLPIGMTCAKRLGLEWSTP